MLQVRTFPPFEAPIPTFVSGMDEEEAALTVGLGLLVREAAAVEYTLHGLLAHLDEKARAYEHRAGATGGQLVKFCVESLGRMDGESPIPATSRHLLAQTLGSCAGRLDERNRFVHSTWAYDNDRQSWLTVKGSRAKGADRPETALAAASDLWELAMELRGLDEVLIAWDIEHFGVPGDPSLGVPSRVSAKNL